MTTHKNYFEIEAETYFELGRRKGVLFGEFLRDSLRERKRSSRWSHSVRQARSYLAVAADAFPHLIDELKGYAETARASFDELWTLSLEDELGDLYYEKCTTIVTNQGSLIAHNEDWDDNTEDNICVLRKTVGNLRMLELYYLNTLGGNAISINSHGFVHAINSLSHTDRQLGIPKNVVARWLSESRSPDNDFSLLSKLKRASGYHHTLVSLDGRIWSIECSATRQVLTRPTPPFIHTNHFLTDLTTFESRGDDVVPGTRTRFQSAANRVQDPMSIDNVAKLVSDASEGRSRSIFNRRTIARMILDVRRMTANVWLLRENEKGWIPYSIDWVIKT